MYNISLPYTESKIPNPWKPHCYTNTWWNSVQKSRLVHGSYPFYSHHLVTGCPLNMNKWNIFLYIFCWREKEFGNISLVRFLCFHGRSQPVPCTQAFAEGREHRTNKMGFCECQMSLREMKMMGQLGFWPFPAAPLSETRLQGSLLRVFGAYRLEKDETYRGWLRLRVGSHWTRRVGRDNFKNLPQENLWPRMLEFESDFGLL